MPLTFAFFIHESGATWYVKHASEREARDVLRRTCYPARGESGTKNYQPGAPVDDWPLVASLSCSPILDLA